MEKENIHSIFQNMVNSYCDPKERIDYINIEQMNSKELAARIMSKKSTSDFYQTIKDLAKNTAETLPHPEKLYFIPMIEHIEYEIRSTEKELNELYFKYLNSKSIENDTQTVFNTLNQLSNDLTEQIKYMHAYSLDDDYLIITLIGDNKRYYLVPSITIYSLLKTCQNLNITVIGKILEPTPEYINFKEFYNTAEYEFIESELLKILINAQNKYDKYSILLDMVINYLGKIKASKIWNQDTCLEINIIKEIIKQLILFFKSDLPFKEEITNLTKIFRYYTEIDLNVIDENEEISNRKIVLDSLSKYLSNQNKDLSASL